MVVYITGALVIVFLLIALLVWFYRWTHKPDADYVLKFVRKNPERSSLTIVKNGKLIADYMSDELRPLASTVKIMVAIEYSRQAVQGEVDPNEPIKAKDLARFYLPKTDGGAHEAWLKMMETKAHLQNGIVSLQEVAKGMISHSSNANTEYLMMRLGLDRINANLQRLNLPRHERIYPLVSNLFTPYEVARASGLDIFKKSEAKKVETLVNEMSQGVYIEEALKIHEKLAQDIDGSYKQRVNPVAWHNSVFDKIVSKRSVRATTSEYVSIMQKINDPSYFSQDVQEHLHPIMEWPMGERKNQETFQYLGAKGGSTAYIITFALFAKDKQGNKFEIAAFFDEILGYETLKLMAGVSAFQLAVLKDDGRWREKLSKLD